MTFLEKLAEPIIQWISEKPKKALWLAGILCFLSLPGLIFIQFDFGVKVWFRTTDPLLEEYNRFLDVFGNDDSVVIALKTKGDDRVFTPENLETIESLTEKFWKADRVIRVESLTNYIYPRSTEDDVFIEDFIQDAPTLDSAALAKLESEALDHAIMPGFVVSRDAKTAIFSLRLKPTFDEQPDYSKLRMQIDEYLEPYESQYDIHFLGTAIVTDTFKDVAIRDLIIMIPLLYVVIFLVLFFLFRQWLPTMIPFVVISQTSLIAMAISGVLGVKLNNLSGMVPNVLMAIAIADAIHLISGFLQAPLDSNRSYESLKKNFFPTLLTSITTCIGFFSLLLSDLVPIQDFGVLCGLGCLFAWIMSVLTVTPLLQLYGPKLQHRAHSGGTSWQVKLTNIIDTHAKKIGATFVAVVATMVFFGVKNEVNSNPFDYFSSSTAISKDNQFFVKKIGGVNGLELIIDSGQANGIHEPEFWNKVEKLQTWLRQQDYVNTTYSIFDQLKEVGRVLKPDEWNGSPTNRAESSQFYLFYSMDLPAGQDPTNLVDLDQKYARVRVLWDIQNSRQSIEETRRIEDKIEEFGLQGSATGQEYLFQGMNEYVVESYFTSIFATILLTSFLLIFILGSVKLGLLSILPNIIPVVVGAGAMYLLGRPIDVGTVLVGSVCFGIAVDDTIHFLASYKRHNGSGESFQEILEAVILEVGTPVVFTTLVLVIGFSVFAFAQFLPNFNFGVFSALVLFVALITDFVFLPVFLKWFPLGEKSS